MQILHFFEIDKVQNLHYTEYGGANMVTLKTLRNEKGLTQQQAADLAGISIRSYKSYENDLSKTSTLKYNYIVDKLTAFNPVDEDHGILSIEEIKKKCAVVFKDREVNFCYLFGSYAKENATPTSDVDLLISTNIKGLKFFELVENLRRSLHKRVDVLDINQLKNNLELTQEILKDGIKIYG